MARGEIVSKVSGFIDKDTVIEGDISFKESFRIDGTFKGRILAGTNLIIGETANVDAEIEVEYIAINGKINGTVKATERAEIFTQGWVTGKLITPKLIIEEGGFLQGTCQMELKALESGNGEEKENS
jgi:cytoskeletal protein CcmA (bactofilin family)